MAGWKIVSNSAFQPADLVLIKGYLHFSKPAPKMKYTYER